MRALAILALLFTLVSHAADGVISGTVRSALTHLPLDDVHISVIGAATQDATTGEDGAFRFTDLAAGKYTVQIVRSGYIAADPIDVAAGCDALTIDLNPMARIEGRVLDEDGHPVPGIRVEANSPPAPSPVPWSISPDTGSDGRFALPNLSPGDFWVRLWIPAALRKDGYPAMQYYPGVTDVDQAATVHLAQSQQMLGFDIRLKRVALVDLRGRIVDLGKDESVRPVEVALDCEPGPIPGSFERRRLDETGRFAFHQIPPGRHQLYVYRGTRHDDLAYAATVTAAKEEVTVTVPPFSTLTGVVKSTTEAPWEGVLSIGVGTAGVWSHIAVPREDGTFELPGMPPGEWSLRLQSNNLHAGKRTVRVSSVRFGTINAGRKPITVTEGENPAIVVTLSDESGSIAGMVDGADPKDLYLIVARQLDGPDDQIATAESKPGGSFLLGGLLPGEYWIAAFDRAVIRKTGRGADCTGHIEKVTVTNGQTSTVKLTRCEQ